MDHHDWYFVESTAREPRLVLIGRLLWLIIGPIALFVLTLFIVITDSGWLTGDDLGFHITVGLMLFSRWLVIRSGHGRTIPVLMQRQRLSATMHCGWCRGR